MLKSRKKSLAKSIVLNPSKWVHILRSVITAIHFSCLFVSLVHLRTYRHLSHTVLSCIVSCEYEHYVRISEQRCLMLVTPVLTFSNCILKTRVIKWPRKLYALFNVFFSKIQKAWLFTFFELLHTLTLTLTTKLLLWYSITHSLFHSRLKSFLFCKSSLPQPFLFLIQVLLYGFPRLFTVTSEHTRLFTF